jgi:hypothetical protein
MTVAPNVTKASLEGFGLKSSMQHSTRPYNVSIPPGSYGLDVPTLEVIRQEILPVFNRLIDRYLLNTYKPGFFTADDGVEQAELHLAIVRVAAELEAMVPGFPAYKLFRDRAEARRLDHERSNAVSFASRFQPSGLGKRSLRGREAAVKRVRMGGGVS